jgi:two-component system, OmpR family, alkaline phosphatase synthesis response regulator PhoP
MEDAKIIVITPDRYQAVKMVTCLQDAGYQVASSGMALGDLADLCRLTPDLLLLEWQPLDPDALHLVRGIRQDTCLKRLPVILMGAGIRDEDALQALDAGADQCWREPFNPPVLIARVRAFLRRNNHHRDESRLNLRDAEIAEKKNHD